MLIPLGTLNDPRIAEYCNLRERTLRGETLFIAEGDLVAERLVRSSFEVLSALVTDSALQRMTFVLNQLPESTPVYCVQEAEMLSRIVGFEFYQGILLLGKRHAIPNAVDGIAEQISVRPLKKSFVWIVLPNATKPDNLGLVFRCSAALGADAVILGEQCCDPFSRRALRVSMGGVLQVPIFQAKNLTTEIEQIQRQFEVDIVGTVLDHDAQYLHEIKEWSPRTAFLFGNEYDGLGKQWSSICNRKLLIPMKQGVDSLNLGVSVGIFLYEFRKAMGFED